ncbi:MAG TPA: hypothetical protein VMB78_00200 [Dissulfurispiraceae bacterium]|nr:hypothetical protein [Dissulfurispiraceae bacterium]
MIKKTVFLLVAVLIAGCAQNIRSHDVRSTEEIPAISYEAYLFVAGISERSRVAFLRHPDADMDIEPASPEIISTTITYPAAMTFMQMKKGMRSISTEVITYKGKPLGYLISYNQGGTNYEFVETNFTERGGKIYFSARENTSADE